QPGKGLPWSRLQGGPTTAPGSVGLVYGLHRHKAHLLDGVGSPEPALVALSRCSAGQHEESAAVSSRDECIHRKAVDLEVQSLNLGASVTKAIDRHRLEISAGAWPPRLEVGAALEVRVLVRVTSGLGRELKQLV